MEATAIVVGPGGVGKSPLDKVFKDTIVRIEAHRLRKDGPRDCHDIFYAHQNMREDLRRVLAGLGDSSEMITYSDEKVEWFKKAEAMLLTVRGEWQCLFLNSRAANEVAKAEIYAPALPKVLSIKKVADILGKAETIVLNPCAESVAEMQGWQDLTEKTSENCVKRGDTKKSVNKRLASIEKEAPAFRELVASMGATEYTSWLFPEHVYKSPPQGVSLLDHQIQTLIDARSVLLAGNPQLERFVKSEGEIRETKEPIVTRRRAQPKLFDMVAVLSSPVEGAADVGDVGTVVEVLPPDGVDVEFLHPSGRTHTVITLKTADVLLLNRKRARLE